MIISQTNTMDFTTNPYYQNNSQFSEDEVSDALEIAKELIKSNRQNNIDEAKFKLIGVGNDAGGKVYSLIGTEFCLKIGKLGKHVGTDQSPQFELSKECEKAVSGKSVEIEGDNYALTTFHSVAVAADDEFAYVLMPRIDNVIRMWDEENIPFGDKDNWPAIRQIKAIIREYGDKSGIGAETFYAQMDVNGNNLLVDLENKLIYLIDPYVPEHLSSEYELLFDKILLESWLYDPLLALSKMNLPDYFVGAGAVTQTVWNYLSKQDGKYGIKDIDFVYYDEKDLSSEGEDKMLKVIKPAFEGVGISVDVVNEARVHLWYEQEFGVQIDQYKSVEEAISTWPTTASSIGVRMKAGTESTLELHTPFGLADLMEMVVRPNKKLVTKEIYEAKAKKWKSKWPKLQVVAW